MVPDWYDLLLPPAPPYSKPTADEEMLRLIAYDIACPKRLRRVAIACEDYGLRVQKSLFECWLEEERFEQLWTRLQSLIKPTEDCLAAYPLDKACANQRRSAGTQMILTQHRHWFIG